MDVGGRCFRDLNKVNKVKKGIHVHISTHSSLLTPDHMSSIKYHQGFCEFSDNNPSETYHGLSWSGGEGKYIAAGCRQARDGCIVCVWRTDSGRVHARIVHDGALIVQNVRFAHDGYPPGELIVLADTAVIVYDVSDEPTPRLVIRFDFERIPSHVTCATVSDRYVAAMAHDDGTISVANLFINMDNPIFESQPNKTTTETFAIAIYGMWIAYTSTSVPIIEGKDMSAVEQRVTLTVMDHAYHENTLTFHGIGNGGALAAAHTGHSYAVDSADNKLWIVTIKEGTRNVYSDVPHPEHDGGYTIRTVPGASFVVAVMWSRDDALLVFERYAEHWSDGIYVCSSRDGSNLHVLTNCERFPLCISPDAKAVGVMETGDDERDVPDLVAI